IEQGQVEQLLTASKADRRIIFEEAAGISKYKSQKKEALRKLDRTDQNLLRLADILGEVQKQLRSIKLQATKARNYLRFSQSLKELQVNYSLAEYHRIITAGQTSKDSLGQLEQGFAAVAAEVGRSEAEMSMLGNEIIETENQINRADNSLVSVQSKIEQLFQRIEFLGARITELHQRKESAGERVEKLQEQKKNFAGELARCRDDELRCERVFKEKTDSSEELQKSIHQTNTDSDCAALEADLEDEKSGIIDIVRMTAQLHNEIQSISVYRSNLSSQKDRLAGRAKVTAEELEKILTEKAQHQARQEDIKKVLGDLQQNLDAKSREAEEVSSQIAVDSKRLAHSKEVRSALASELAVLTDMESRREGLNNAVKSILASSSAENGEFDYVESVLADIIVADVEYATAIEAALEGKTDTLVAGDTSQLIADNEKIQKLDGRVSFICTDKVEPFVDKADLSGFDCVKGRAVEFVKYDSKYASLA
ncbi:MAG: coiled-coil domain-containing protein, partial [Planctomycetota bacterium]